MNELLITGTQLLQVMVAMAIAGGVIGWHFARYGEAKRRYDAIRELIDLARDETAEFVDHARLLLDEDDAERAGL